MRITKKSSEDKASKSAEKQNSRKTEALTNRQPEQPINQNAEMPISRSADKPTSRSTETPSNATSEVGFVTFIQDFLIHLEGLPNVSLNDIIENDTGTRGWITSLSPNSVSALLLDDEAIKPGERFFRTNKKLTVSVGDFLLGRAINPLGIAIDGKGLLSTVKKDEEELDKPALGIKYREIIKDQLDTGITLVDTLLPLGKGQRELVIGDARSGKSSFILDLIINQKKTNVICIYAIIGKPISDIRASIDVLSVNNALSYTVLIASPSTDPSPLIYLTPQTAFSVAEYFQKKGKDVLLILDDMGTHAKIYREISLLSESIPGRESYPGDIFYQHAHILERAGKFTKAVGGGSITAIPVIETGLSDFTTLIPTNLMAMTDGHLLFRSSISNQGQRPAIDIPLSVSRVGPQTQTPVEKNISSKIKAILTQSNELKTLSSFSGELSEESQLLYHQGQVIFELLKQDSLTLITKELQLIILGLILTGFYNQKNVESIIARKAQLLNMLSTSSELSPLIKNITNVTENELIAILQKITPELEKIFQEGGKQN